MGGWGVKLKTPLCEAYGYFLEQHNVTKCYLSGSSRPGVILGVSAFVVLLLAIALVYSNPLINLKQTKPTNEFHKDEAKGWLISFP